MSLHKVTDDILQNCLFRGIIISENNTDHIDLLGGIVMNLYTNNNYRKSNKLVPIVLMVIWGAALVYSLWSAFNGYTFRWFDYINTEYGLTGFIYGFIHTAFYAGIASFLFAAVMLVFKALTDSGKRTYNRAYSPYNQYNRFGNSNQYNNYNRYNARGW